MAKKVLLQDWNKNEILPITRGELILDSSGKEAFHSKEFLATTSQPGLMSNEDKTKLDSLVIDTSLSTTSTNPVQNKVITTEINNIKKSYLKSATVSNNTLTIVDQSNNSLNFYNTTYNTFSKETSEGKGGNQGLVPIPNYNSGSSNRYLKEDGTWAKPDNTTYTFEDGTNGFTVTSSSGDEEFINVIPNIDNNVIYSGTLVDKQVAIFDRTSGIIKASGYTIASNVPSGAKFTDTTYNNGEGLLLSNYTFSLKKSSTDKLGGIKIAKDNAYTVATHTSNLSQNITTVNQYYGVELDSTGKAFVYVPWLNTEYSLMDQTEANTGTATTARTISAKVLHDKIKSLLPSVMAGATSSSDGESGLVPKPVKGNQDKYLKGDGSWDTPLNNKVTQTNTTNNAEYRVLFSENANDTTSTEGARKSTNLKFNPNTGTLTAITFNGNLDWSKITNKPTSFTPSAHTHPTNQINALTGYSKAGGAADLATTDTLNTALGKLEYKADAAYTWYKSIFGPDTDDIINKYDEIVDFVDSVKEGADITDEFVTRKTTQTITGAKTFSQVITSTVADGTAPFIITSGTLVTNLNADKLDGFHASGLFQSLSNIASTDISNPNTIAIKIGNTTKYLKVGYATKAGSVSNQLILKINSGTAEGTNLYTYDGSNAKTLDIKAGSNITLTPTEGVLTISATNSNTTYTLSGALNGNTFDTILTPSNGDSTKATVPAMTGATASAAGKAGLVPAPGAGKNTSFLRGDGTWAIPLDTKVTSADNHYDPSTDTNYTLDRDASSTTAAAWGTTSLVTGVTLSRDSKGHVTGLSIDSIKLPTISNTWRAIQVNGTQIAGTGTNTYALNFVQGDGITIKGETGTSSSVNKITITNSGVPISAYSYTSGYLVETDIATESNTMITFRIEGNSYGYDSILTTGQFYNHTNSNQILNTSAIHHGYNFGNITVFCYNKLVYLWFAQQSNYQSFVVYVYGTNVNTKGVNRVTSITNSALPTSGVTRKVTITPVKRGAYSFSGGVDKFTVTSPSGSATDVSVGTLLVNGTYTGNGGGQCPSYIGSGKVRWNMMNATTTYFDSSPFSGYCDWMMMDTYTGSDVPYVTMIGVLKSATPHAYIASGAKGDSSGKWTIKTLLDSSNYTSYVNSTNFPGLNKTGTVTSVTAGTGLAGGTITTSGTISINSTYQTYISNGNTAYGWGNHADAGYAYRNQYGIPISTTTDLVHIGYGYATGGWKTSGPAIAFGAPNGCTALIQQQVSSPTLYVSYKMNGGDVQAWNQIAFISDLTWANVTGKPSFFSGNYNDLTNKPDLSNYVTLDGTQTITGFKTFTNYIYVSSGCGIVDSGGTGILGVYPTTWTGVPTDGSAVGLGALGKSLYIRTSGNNLYHYRNDTDNSYNILDSGNWSSYITLPTIPSLSLGTTTGSGNAVTSISVSGHTITLNKGTTFLTAHSIKTLTFSSGTFASKTYNGSADETVYVPSNFNHIGDASNLYINAGTVTRRIIVQNTKNNQGYISRASIGLSNPANQFSPVIIGVGTNDAGTTYTDYYFHVGGSITDSKGNTYAKTSDIPTKTSQLDNDSNFITSRGYIGITPVQETSGNQALTGINNITTPQYGFTITTPVGNIQIGPQNSTGCHIYTNKDLFYFNKPIYYWDGSSSHVYISEYNYTSYTPILNSSSTHATKSSVIYAPITSGSGGDLLISDGQGSAPVWTSPGNVTVGGASKADKLTVARTIALSGAVTGSASFDGSANITITTSVNHTHSYLVSGSTLSGSSHAEALKTYFTNNKASIPRCSLNTYYSSAMSNGSQYFGYFLSGYDSTPYGGFYVAHYDTPYYVGISYGTFTQHKLAKISDLTWTNITGKPTIPTLYERNLGVNGNNWTFSSPYNTATTTIYAPTSAGISGQVLVSTGGTPTWQTISTGGGYIGTTPVQSSEQTQNLTGIGGITANSTIQTTGSLRGLYVYVNAIYGNTSKDMQISATDSIDLSAGKYAQIYISNALNAIYTTRTTPASLGLSAAPWGALYAASGTFTGNISANGGSFYTNANGAYHTSDIRKKTNITKAGNLGIADLLVEFDWKDSSKHSWGYIAQDLLEVLPEAVDYNEDIDVYSVNYNVAHSAAIASLTARIKELEEKLKKYGIQ